MPEKWTGDLIGKMHNHGIKQRDLANRLGVSNSYVGMILRGERKPYNIKERMESAVNNILCEKTDVSSR